MIDLTAKFLKELSVDFERIIATDEAVCEVFATDNSIYHRLPLALVFPKSTAYVRKICFLAAKTRISQNYFNCAWQRDWR